jgi:catechol 2,3-dioxygenase-like lactoylglutathione lyase family enzyme
MESAHLARLSVVTLGVADLEKATAFYTTVFGISPNPDYEGVSFFGLPGTWISLYPIEKLAEDISPILPSSRSGFTGITLAHNVRSKEEAIAVIETARAAGATVIKPPQDTAWGGFSGYFADLDGYHWEVVWAPMFNFAPDGSLRFQAPEAPVK